MERQNYSSGAPLEELAGYSRMVRIGSHIYIGGTTSTTAEGTVIGKDAYEQARYIFDRFLGLLDRTGASAGDVYKVKGYVLDMSMAKDVARAYSESFRDARPLFTLVGTPMLNRPSQLVELELEAHLGCELVSR